MNTGNSLDILSGCQRLGTAEIVNRARANGLVIPAFNIPYLPMMRQVVRALRDTNSFGMIAVARLEWIKFESQSMSAVRAEYEHVRDERHTRLHLDHIPVIDEDNVTVDAEADIAEAIRLGYESVMIDGSRLTFADNVKRTRNAVELAREAGIACEAELGAIMGHEAGPLPPYEELYVSGKGFTDPDEAVRFVNETGVDWLSVAIGNIHGAISKVKKDERKVEARLNIAQLDRIHQAVGIPLVLHGGTGIRKEYIKEAIRHGIAKINVAAALRQAWEQGIKSSRTTAEEAVYAATVKVIHEDFEIGNSADILLKGIGL
ncbi:MAG: class II fructose-bisphosphate aldolase [bacterium]